MKKEKHHVHHIPELDEDELVPEEESKYKGPIKVILAIALALMVLIFIFPFYHLKFDPSPKEIPSLDEVLPAEFEVVTYNSSSYFANLHPEEPVVKQVANKVVTIACDSDKICHSKALFYFVRDNFNYVGESGEYLMSSSEMLYSGGDDCDGHSILLANLLQSVGIKTRFVFFPRHVMVQAWLPDANNRYKVNDDWIFLDPTCEYCEFGELPQKYAYSDMSLR